MFCHRCAQHKKENACFFSSSDRFREADTDKRAFIPELVIKCELNPGFDRSFPLGAFLSGWKRQRSARGTPEPSTTAQSRVVTHELVLTYTTGEGRGES